MNTNKLCHDSQLLPSEKSPLINSPKMIFAQEIEPIIKPQDLKKNEDLLELNIPQKFEPKSPKKNKFYLCSKKNSKITQKTKTQEEDIFDHAKKKEFKEFYTEMMDSNSNQFMENFEDLHKLFLFEDVKKSFVDSKNKIYRNLIKTTFLVQVNL